MKKFIEKISIIIASFTSNFTLAKFLAAGFTILIVAGLKYYVSGGFTLDNKDILNNIAIGFLSWITNTSMVSWFTNYLGLKGINFNLNELFYGLDKMKLCTTNSSCPTGLSAWEDSKPMSKLYNAMDSNDNNKSNDLLDKGKRIESNVSRLYDNNGNETVPYAVWNKVYPGVDPTFPPKGTNPGPGFNVPGGEVPIRDPICEYIGYNSHILNQYKTMDLETAINQRDNTLLLVQSIEGRLNYVRNALTLVPENPVNVNQLNLKNRILSDLQALNRDKIRAEARTTLLISRIEYIENKVNENKNTK